MRSGCGAGHGTARGGVALCMARAVPRLVECVEARVALRVGNGGQHALDQLVRRLALRRSARREEWVLGLLGRVVGGEVSKERRQHARFELVCRLPLARVGTQGGRERLMGRRSRTRRRRLTKAHACWRPPLHAWPAALLLISATALCLISGLQEVALDEPQHGARVDRAAAPATSAAAFVARVGLHVQHRQPQP
jgi:hypothetical protein